MERVKHFGIISKLIIVNLVIFLAVAGIVAVNFYSSRQVGKVTLVLSGLVCVVLIGVGVYAVRIIRPLGDLAKTAEQLAKGDITCAIRKITSRDEIGTLATAFMQLITYFQAMASAATKISQGDLAVQIEILSEKDTLGASLNMMVDNIRNIIEELNILAHSATEGKLDVRGDSTKFEGEYAKIVKGINDTLDAVIGPLNVAAEYMDRIARGDVPARITDNYQGDFTEIKNNLNMLIGAMTGLLEETAGLITAIQHGNLSVRGNTEHFTGSWRDLITGINNLIDAFVAPITVTSERLERIAKGDIPDPIIAEYQGDFNTIKYHLNYLIGTTIGVTAIAQQIAGGNLGLTVELRSEQDELMRALQQMLAYLQNVAAVAEKISNQNLNVEVAPQSERDTLNQALKRMITTLQTMMHEVETSMQEVQQQNWLMTGQAELSNAMRGEQHLPALSKNIITFLAKYTQAHVGALYLSEQTHDKTLLRLTGSYAFSTRRGDHEVFELGEGLVGQAALEQESILYTDVPGDYMIITSGLGEIRPRQILVLPFLYEGELRGVVELGTAHEFSEAHRRFLEQVQENIAIAINTAHSRVQMHELLEATKRQAEELQIQQETLRATNEQLQDQASILRESEYKLQQQQEELRQTNDQLKSQAQELDEQRQSLEIKNQALENAHQLLESKAAELELASKYKSEFLANMSHELRTPLNNLLILSKLLADNKDGNLTEKQVEFANTVHSAGTDLLALINEVLDLSKIEAGKMTLTIDAMSLQGLVLYIKRNFQHVAEEKGLSLTIDLAEELPDIILTDRQRVEQIVKNFLSNALKFTAAGSVHVWISRPEAGTDLSRSGLSCSNSLGIAVIDTGTGIPQDKQRIIFEAFQQVDGTTSRKYGGTGLGLSISRELAKLLGGEIQLHSEVGKGSTFTLYLPEEIRDGERQQYKGHAEPAPGLRTPSLDTRPPAYSSPSSSEKIWDDRHERRLPSDKFLLIIEDDAKFAAILFELAHEKGFKGLIANDGAAGLQLAHQYRPVGIILDIGLPDMNGQAVLERLKQHPETKGIPVHIISAYDKSVEMIGMGAVGYLTKPVTLEMLHQVFNSIEQAIAKTIKKVLIVEDDATMRMSLTELLKGENLAITSVETGEEAYHCLRTDTFDCMILDLGLRDIPGERLLERLRHDKSIRDMPVIIHTGKELNDQELIDLEAYSDSIIIKGAKSAERLLDEVRLFLNRVAPATSELQPAQQTDLSARTILLVDDDMRNVFALTSVLEDQGMTVIMAESGNEAVESLQTHPGIDLILMDIMMPHMDGYEAIREIRKLPQFQKLPIIALTAKALKGDRQKCLDAGANDYLSKPIDISKLFSLLHVWLQ